MMKPSVMVPRMSWPSEDSASWYISGTVSDISTRVTHNCQIHLHYSGSLPSDISITVTHNCYLINSGSFLLGLITVEYLHESDSILNTDFSSSFWQECEICRLTLIKMAKGENVPVELKR
jgi:hypothetical protein